MPHSIHAAAAKGFQSASDAYERGRPEYPQEAVTAFQQALGITPQSFLVDLGAGTGKFTRLLVDSQARILGIEPVEAMREKFASILPQIDILSGTAESMPLADQSVDVLVVAQAFHWFNGPVALAEIHRVLKKGGRLGLIWNARDESVDWFRQLTMIYDEYENGAPQYRHGRWKAAFETTQLFTQLKAAHFPYRQRGNVQTVVDRILSISFIAALPPEIQAQVEQRVRNLLETHPLTRNRLEFEIPYQTDIFWCEKIG